ncbi:MAG: UDP-N-acetylmuramoyl-L-alanine--D-glutamate ligase [Bacteroidetes bacterium]|nr:UDP-N-acetylmuramoyl-L-alanine--D-glutamate ligase [Bacteroidota bacterium]MBK9413804.1 UDP-N-acetylmuramoyl-L-alanine--D-glutamate ligase [Bacteroidota bacterium]MBP6427798.1 UDP-N-acetylmuramoyl-L-alanine--D-glutamate ligase [Bacteroidia bacterium]MBP6657384.1 UDP-N-acetylmuramoyl-L-alanine--D-glutamate ligase [Bacteroidia bacterium]
MNTQTEKKKLVVLGAGESGVGTAVLAQKQGFDVFVSDKGEIKPEYRAALEKYKIRFEEGKHDESEILSANEIVKSPGIPEKVEILKKIRNAGIPVVSEIEFAGRYSKAKMIGITGTNGKTTTTMLVYHILQKAGLKVGLAGNVGKSFAMQVAEQDFDYYVLELSSFQLDDMYHFKCDIAILTNITPDHLDRYNYELKNYVMAKFRIVQNQTSADAFIYCADDAITTEYLPSVEVKSKKYPFSLKSKVEQGAYVEDQQLIINTNNNQFTMLIHELALQGKHNLHNTMAAGITAQLVHIRKEVIRESMIDFRNVEHRLEFVNTIHGIEFYNDSKATNVNSTWFALESFNKPVVLILGGVDKGNDYEMLEELIKEKVKAIVCLGKDNKKIFKAFSGMVEEIVETDSAESAVRESYRLSKKGDVVLLSPACASFDLFENYEDRGRQFKKAVKSL